MSTLDMRDFRFRALIAPAIAILALTVPQTAVGQVLTPRSTFALDLGSGVIAGTLPFDEPFYLSTPATPSLRGIRLWVGPQLTAAECRLLAPRRDSLKALGVGNTTVSPINTQFDNERTKAGAALKDQRTRVEANRKASDDARIQLDNLLSQNNPNPADVEKARETLAEAETTEGTSRVVLRYLVADSSRIRKEAGPTSAWYRGDTATSILLDVGELLPNSDYRFCVHALRDPSEKEATDFSAKATKALTTLIRQFAKKAPAPAAALDTLQMALIASLPTEDSIDVRDSASIFLRPADDKIKEQRLTRLSILYANVRQALTNRTSNITKADNQATTIATAIQALAAERSALTELARIADDANVAKVRSGAFVESGVLAARLAARPLSPAIRTEMGFGLRRIDDFGGGQSPGRKLSDMWNAVDLKPFTDLYQKDEQLLVGLIELVDYARRNPTAVKPQADLGLLSAVEPEITAVLKALVDERRELGNVAAVFDRAAQPITQLVDSLRVVDLKQVAMRGSTLKTFQARAESYISLDVGFTFFDNAKALVPYFGANVYFRPVNRNKPLWKCGCLRQRLSVTLGVTATTVKQEKRLDDLFNGHAVFVGAGFRILDYWRVSAGSLLLKTYRDGTTEPAKTTAIAAASTSFDIDVARLLGSVGSLFIPNFK